MRSWIAETFRFALVVMTAAEGTQSPDVGSFQTAQRPAIAMTAPAGGWRRYGCLTDPARRHS